MIRDLWDYIIEEPHRILVSVLVCIVFTLSGWDIGKGHWVTNSGIISGKYTHTDCDDDGCDTDYYVEVSHSSGHDDVHVNGWDFWKYHSGTPVRISYREGGVFHIRWFKSVEQMPPNSY